MKRLEHLIGTLMLLIIIALSTMHPFLAIAFVILYCLSKKC